jgi:ABC-type amino acid transport substrate-binding protein
MTITEELQETTSISIAYLKNKQVAVIRVEDKEKYKTTEDMKDAVIVAEAGSAGQLCVEKGKK